MRKCTVAMLGGLALGLAGLSNGNAQTAVAPATSNQWTNLQSKHDLPPEALAAFVRALGELADRNEPFQVSDAVLGEELPMKRFIQGRSNGREIILDFEQGGRGYGRRTARFQFVRGRWVLVGTSD